MRIFGDRRGAANLSPLLMILAFGSMIALLVWLGATSEGTETQAFNPQEEEVDPLEQGAIDADEARLQNPGTLEGETARLEAPVASRVGDEAFFLDYSAAPFLVKIGDQLLSEGQGVPEGDVVVVGTVHAMTDSIIEDWIGREVVSEADRPIVEFATHFVEAAILRETDGDDEGDDDGEGDGAGADEGDEGDQGDENGA